MEIFFYDVGKVLYKYCTSTFPISTLPLCLCILCGRTYDVNVVPSL